MAGELKTGPRTQGRRVRDHLPRRFVLLRNPFVQVLLFTFFMVVAVLLIRGTLAPSNTPLTKDKIGSPAPRDIKAPRAFIYTKKDTEATELKRKEAALLVPKVYDFQRDEQLNKVHHIREAFREMRDVLREAAQKQQPPPDLNDWPKPSDSSATSTGVSGPAATSTTTAGNSGELQPHPSDLTSTTVAVVPPKPLTAKQRLEATQPQRGRFDQALQFIVPDKAFEEFALGGFPADAEAALISIVHALYDRQIVPNRRLLEIEAPRGINLRIMDGERIFRVEKRTDFNSFIDLTEARQELTRLGALNLASITDPGLRKAILDTAEVMIQPNTTYNSEITRTNQAEARNAVQDLVVRMEFQKGQNIVDRRSIIEARHVEIVQASLSGQNTPLSRVQILIGTVLLTLGLLIALFLFSRANISKFKLRPKDAVFLGAMVLISLLIQQGTILLLDFLDVGWDPAMRKLLFYALPFAVSAMLVRLVLNSETSLIFTLYTAILVGVASAQSLDYTAFLTVSMVTGAGSVGKVNHRMDLLKAGLIVGIANTLVALSLALLHGEPNGNMYLLAVLFALVGGLLSGVLVSALLPLFEWIFDYTTDIKLLELADLNHPALRELIMKAPGSYHHSVIVGNLCKEAAEAIQANPLLARVGAYYHDIGKGKNPQYFAENQRAGQNPHDKLKPNMSALIIKAHVKDGLEIARQHRLPREILDFIAQHHGTSLIAYFYHRAKSMEDPSIPEVDEKDYRYPGPKPQTRETAICLLADGIEAASRAMPDPTPDRLKGLVQKMINKAFADGQLDECELTLKDLNAIAKAFIRVLIGMYHARPQYPEDRKPPKPANTRPPRTSSKSTGPQARQRHTTQPLPNVDGDDSKALAPTREMVPHPPTKPRTRSVIEDRLGDDDPEVLALHPLTTTLQKNRQKVDSVSEIGKRTTRPIPHVTPRTKDTPSEETPEDLITTNPLPKSDGPPPTADTTPHEGAHDDASGSDSPADSEDPDDPDDADLADPDQPRSLDETTPPPLRRLGLS